MKKLFKIGSENHGRGAVLFAWHPEGNLLATAGTNGLVNIFDRHGRRVDEISPEGGCMVRSLDWDHEGECLAILLEGTGIVPLWDAGSRSIQRLDTNMSDPSFMVWSQTGLLAVGMTKGNLLLYNRRTRKKIPVLGKHPKRITCGAWSRGNQLALGSDDRTFTLSNGSGDTLEQTTIKHPPTEMHFWTRRQRSDGGGKESEEDENCVSIIMDGRSLLLMNVKEPDNPTELAFKDSYGDIVCHRWFGDGQIAIAFSEGYLVAISTNPKELGEELFCGRFYSTGLVGMDYCEAQGCVAMAGEGGVKIVNMQRFEEMKGDSVSMEQDEARISKLGWSPDGQILTVASRSGVVYNFLANLPALHASYGSKLAYLSSLRELTVLEGAVAASSSKGSPPRPLLIPLSMEPSFLALGASHAAVGMNNRVSFYRALPNDKSCVAEEDYMGRVEDVKLNKMHAAVLSAGQVILHSIEPNSRVGNSRTTIPDPGNTETNSTVICMGLTDSLLIYGTSGGCVELFHLQEWAALSGVGLRHQHSIRRLCPNYLGTRILVMDTRGGAFVFSTALGDAVQVPSFPSSPGAIFWDQSDRHVFSAADGGGNLHVYAYVASSVRGATVTKLGPAEVDASGSVTIRAQASPMPVAHTPILSYGGLVTCQIDSGSLATFVAAPFDALESHTPARATPAAYRSCFLQNLALLRLKHAWRAAVKLDDRAHYLALGNRAMEVMDVHMAIHVYRELGDAGMVMGLEEISHVEDKNLLAGHIALLFGDYSVAQELFLSSSTPEMALQMRRDLMQWDHALKLAQTLNPKAVPGISAELGQQLEFKGEWEAALHAYEAALAGYTQGDLSSESKRMEYDPYDSAQELLPPEKHALCTHGLARCTLRLGDLRHGISMAKETRSPQLLGECAAILEDMKQYSESASLWELSGQPERAAAIHIQTKDFSALASIIGKVTMPKLLCQYAKICESTNNFQAAADAYERARDMDSVVRLCLEKLRQPERAFDIVRTTASSSGATMLSKYCQEMSDWKGAMEFLLMAKQSGEAFELAKSHGQMAAFTDALGNRVTPNDAIAVAKYYESQHEMALAGKFYTLCGQYHRALKLFLQCGDKEVDAAIAVVGKARNDMLTHTLIDFLMGETDGVTKDPNYIYRLYMALGNFSQAAKTAIIIARQEQDLGNYKVAHAVLYETIKQLESQRVRVPRALRSNFVLLHSYMLVKSLARREDHEGAARMLLRVAKNVSKFPSHVVPILTSTVVECQRAGLKNSAFQYASTLMRQEHRGKIDKNVRRQIEAIVRRPSRDEEPEALSECPISGIPIPVTQLECPTTKDALPMCVVTGRHMERGDWCICPVSGMPALLTAYKRYIEWTAANGERDHTVSSREGIDPVMGQPVSSSSLKRCTPEEIQEQIKAYNMSEAEEKEAQAADDEKTEASKGEKMQKPQPRSAY